MYEDYKYELHVFHVCVVLIRAQCCVQLSRWAVAIVVLLVWCHAKVVVYWVGVANQSELNTSPRMQTSDFSGEEQKTQRESWKITCLKTVHVVCTTSDVLIAEVDVYTF